MDPNLVSLGQSYALSSECLRDIERLLTKAPSSTLAPPESGSVRGARDGWPERYDAGHTIARGGMGEVRRVFDRKLQRHVAMKLLSLELAESQTARRRFESEAEITAQLAHPGVVPVFDRGEFADRRPWYTMQEVQGETLTSILLRMVSGQAGSWPVLRVLRIFHRLCETVAFAHHQGIIHRDLKPANMMIGRFGEVLVMDWGLAKRLNVTEHAPEASGSRQSEDLLTRAGAVLGTPAYMAPEQARGTANLDATADTYALGVILHEIVTGRLPVVRSGQLDAASFESRNSGTRARWAELFELCRGALAHDSRTRPLHAGQFAESLGGWLDREKRQAEAKRLVARADQVSVELAEKRREVERVAKSARRLAAEQKSYSSIEAKRPAWELATRAERLGRSAALLEVEWLRHLSAALHLDVEVPEAHERLATHYAAQLAQAERDRRPLDAAKFESLLEAHAPSGVTRTALENGALSLQSNPSGAVVRAFRYVEIDRRLSLRSVGVLGVTPLERVELPRGSYLLSLEAPGHAPVRYPVNIMRAGHWDGVCPGTGAALAVDLPRIGALGDDELYVPLGWFQSGGDQLATESLPARDLWVDSFVIQRHPVTHAEYLAFLNDCVAHGRLDEAERYAPRLPLAVAGAAAPLAYQRRLDATFLLAARTAATPWGPSSPVTLVDWYSAAAYARWYAERTGHPWRLHNELEWEKAARGTDGRHVCWGDALEPTYACMLGSHPHTPEPVSVHSFPTDESPYEMRGSAGNVREWCGNVWVWDGPVRDDRTISLDIASDETPGLRAVRGGAWSAMPDSCRAAGRFAMAPEERLGAVGFRLVRSYRA